MLRFILYRLVFAIPSVIGVIVITFIITHTLPGDPAAYFAGPNPTPESIAQIRHQLGLDLGLPAQFWIYVTDLAHGDMGLSLVTGQPVLSDLMAHLPASLELTLVGLLMSVIISIPLGISAALRPGSTIDYVCRSVSTLGVSSPPFLTGLILLYVFYYLLGWAPAPYGRLDLYATPPQAVTGFLLVDSLLEGNLETFRAALAQIILPASSLALFSLAPLARTTRASMIATLSSDFIRTARAAGLRRSKIVITYAFANAILPVITSLGMVFSFLLGANVMVEKVFSWPGIGSYAIDSLVASDYAPVQGFVLVMAMLFIALNAAIDIVYHLLDPRFRVIG